MSPLTLSQGLSHDRDHSLVLPSPLKPLHLPYEETAALICLFTDCMLQSFTFGPTVDSVVCFVVFWRLVQTWEERR